MSKIIGIDLGTTNSAVAVLEGTESKSSQTQKETAQLRLLCLSKMVKSSLVMKTPSSNQPRYYHLYQIKMGTSEKFQQTAKNTLHKKSQQ